MIDGVYLAYPIDQAGPASMAFMFEQAEKMKQQIIAQGLASWVFDPGDAFQVNQRLPITNSVGHINRVAANQAELLVAFLPDRVPSVGVPMEIDRARAQGQHVIVFSDSKSFMLQMAGVHRFNAWEDTDLNNALDLILGMHSPEMQRRMRILPTKLLTEGAQLPHRTYPDDAGLDLYTSERTTIPPGTFQDVPAGVSVRLPEYAWGLVTGRSSALRTRGLLVHTGIIDTGYHGPLFAGAWNMTDHEVVIEEGERIAQLIIINNETMWNQPAVVDDLGASTRGSRGFGSSGA